MLHCAEWCLCRLLIQEGWPQSSAEGGEFLCPHWKSDFQWAQRQDTSMICDITISLGSVHGQNLHNHWFLSTLQGKAKILLNEWMQVNLRSVLSIFLHSFMFVCLFCVCFFLTTIILVFKMFLHCLVNPYWGLSTSVPYFRNKQINKPRRSIFRSVIWILQWHCRKYEGNLTDSGVMVLSWFRECFRSPVDRAWKWIISYCTLRELCELKMVEGFIILGLESQVFLSCILLHGYITASSLVWLLTAS